MRGAAGGAPGSRLFVAVVPPDDVLEAVAALPRPVEPGVRWTRPDTWHVTLRFLGDRVDEGAAVAALASLRWRRCARRRRSPRSARR